MRDLAMMSECFYTENIYVIYCKIPVFRRFVGSSLVEGGAFACYNCVN